MGRTIVLAVLMLIAGLVLLVKGADFLVDGASGLAARMRVPALVVGLTVVAFGTSAPELAVSVAAAIRGSTDLAVGNVVGSNICNILLILGVASLIRPLPVRKNSFRLDIPVLLLASVLLVALGAWGERLDWWDGLIMLAVFAVYMTVLIAGALKKKEAPPAVPPQTGLYARLKKKIWFLILLTIGGIAAVALGGSLLVRGATDIAAVLSVPQDVIGLTVVAIGTSLPELVTSAVAAKKGETDIAVGNVLGSNVFNIFLVAGVSSLFHPLAFTVGENLIDGLVALAAVLLLLFCAMASRGKVKRWAGAVMLLSFVGYYVYLFLARL